MLAIVPTRFAVVNRDVGNSVFVMSNVLDNRHIVVWRHLTQNEMAGQMAARRNVSGCANGVRPALARTNGVEVPCGSTDLDSS